ncbi:VanZ family protein [Zhouia sp. PK063]|uniref:VanZ family protein n=1 Tax=Zhouia sp. PK063 TaxID=3373602 RepID=UPI0037B33B9B
MLYTLGVAFLSLMPLSDEVVEESPVSDKFVHFVFYTIFAIVWLLYFQTNERLKVKKYLKVFLSVFVFGMIIECFQYIMPYNRHFDLTDVFFNLCGGLLGILLMFIVFKVKKA